VISTDGGRWRERRESAVLTPKKGRRRYFGEWREPKRLPSSTLEAAGRPERDVLPVIDGPLGGAEALFLWLKHSLAKLDIGAADTLVGSADGAHGIGNRLGEWLTGLGLAPGQWREGVDFSPAVEPLG